MVRGAGANAKVTAVCDAKEHEILQVGHRRYLFGVGGTLYHCNLRFCCCDFTMISFISISSRSDALFSQLASISLSYFTVIYSVQQWGPGERGEGENVAAGSDFRSGATVTSEYFIRKEINEAGKIICRKFDRLFVVANIVFNCI